MSGARPRTFGWNDSLLWLPLWIDAALSIVLQSVNANHALFFAINGLPRWTGDTLWAVLTLGGDYVAALAMALPLLYWRPRVASGILAAAALTWAMSRGFKIWFDLPRPLGVLTGDQVHVIGPQLARYAFPSGHTAVAFVLAGMVLLPSSAQLRSRLVPWVGGWAILVGVSRVAVGAHWPSDVLAGAVVGWLCAIAGHWVAWRWPVAPRSRTEWSVAAICASAVVMLPFRSTGFVELGIWQTMIAALALGVAMMYVLRRYAP